MSEHIFKDVKLGDKFRAKTLHNFAQEGVITVTGLTEKGFKYTVEKPYQLYPARYGPHIVSGGELYVNDHPEEMWEGLYERVV